MKRIAKTSILSLLIIVIGLFAFLLPAHLQVREVEPTLPSEDALRAVLGVDNSPVQVSFITTSSQTYAAGTLGHNSVVVEWANGDLALIDTGMDEASALEFGALMETVIGAGKLQINGTIAHLLGEDITRVKAVAFTHLHIDHAQGTADFCKARGAGAMVLQSTYQRTMHNFNTDEAAAIVANSCLEPEVVASDGLISFERFPGLAMYPLGGHTPGSTLFVVAYDERLLLFSGDITNTKADIVADRGKGFLYSYLLVPENTARTATLRKWLRTLDQKKDIEVVVSHDLENMQAVLKPFHGP